MKMWSMTTTHEKVLYRIFWQVARFSNVISELKNTKGHASVSF